MKKSTISLRVLSLVLTLALILGLCPVVLAAEDNTDTTNALTTTSNALVSFEDVDATQWYAEYVDYVVDQGLMVGTSDVTFAPTEAVNRATVATVIWRMEGSQSNTGTAAFADVSATAWYAEPILWCAENEIVLGDGTNFMPSDAITREQLALMLYRYAGTDAGEAELDFTDADKVDSWAVDAVKWAVKIGLLNGKGNGILDPQGILTRVELAAVLQRFLEEAPGIVAVYSLGFLDYDGAKVSAVAVEYNVDLTGAEISVDDFEVGSYPIWNPNKVEIGENAGVPVAAYINDKPVVSEDGGSGSGCYVIIELDTDYQLSGAEEYTISMSVDVLQTGTLTTNSCTIQPGTEAVANYVAQEHVSMMGTVSMKRYANEGYYSISGGEQYVFHTVDGTGENAPFYATHCFDEATGLYSDVTVPYMIFVPEDYDANGNYGLVVMIGSAGCASNDGMVTMTESMSPSNLASDEVQQYAKDAGLDGLIVLLPQVPEGLRSTRDNWTTSSAVSAHWQLIDYIVDTYSIDTNRIYGTGHSMGGMQILEMAAQRDNFFAAIWSIGCQWGENYNKEELYEGATYYTAPADGTIIWNVDADGNACDYQNWAYMVSDDNILITNCVGDAFSSGTWQELAYLYEDLCGVTFPKVTVNPLTTTDEEQNDVLNDLLAMESDNGFYWLAFEGGSHTGTWIYAHHITAGYQWLLSQTRETEQARDKLDLDKPFELADNQIQTEERILGTNEDGDIVYYATGKYGSGTADYNSPVYVHSGTPAKNVDWDPEPLLLNTTTDDSGFACIVLQDGTVIWEMGIDSCTDLIRNYDITGEYAAIHVRPMSEEDYPYLYPEDGWEMVAYGEQPEWFDIEMYRAAWYAFAEWEYQVYTVIFDYEGLRSVTAQDTLDAAPGEDYVVTEEDIAALREYALVTNSLPTNMRTSVLNTLYATVGRSVATDARAYMNDIGLGSGEGQLNTMTNLMALSDTLGVSNQGVNQTGYYAAIAASYFDVDDYIYFPYATDETYFPYSVCLYLWEHGMVVSQDSDDVWRLHAADDVFNILATVDGTEVSVNKAFSALIDENNNVYWKVGADNVDAVKSYYGLSDDLVEVQIEPILEKEDASIVLIDGYNRDATIIFPYLDPNSTWTIEILNGETPDWYNADSEAALLVALEEWKDAVYGGFDFEKAGVDVVFPAETTLEKATYTEDDIALLADWARAWHNVSDQGISLAVSINQTISSYSSANIWDNFDSYLTSLWRDVHVQCPGGCIEDGYERDVPDGNPTTNIGDVVADVMAALGGYYFSGITDWAYYTGDTTTYPYAAGAELVLKNLVPITDGTNWYFASGEESWIIFSISEAELLANY